MPIVREVLIVDENWKSKLFLMEGEGSIGYIDGVKFFPFAKYAKNFSAPSFTFWYKNRSTDTWNFFESKLIDDKGQYLLEF